MKQIPTGSEPHEAMLYERQSGGRVLCRLCAHRCLIDDGKRGACHVRENRAGALYTLVYNRIVSQNVDPVEKKPLFHFYPGATLYSIATQGCNFHCQYCTNWSISQASGASLQRIGQQVSPEEVVSAALAEGSKGVAYTYVEPTIFFEYVHDTARLASAAGLANVFKTNGFMTPEMLELCRPYLNAANVDLKSFREETYRHFGGRLGPVLDNLKLMRESNIWVEVTTLIIPGVNDSPVELRAIANFLCKELGEETPWHISRFFPAFKMTNVAPTPAECLHKAREIGLAEGLRHIYFANLPEKDMQNTTCCSCGHTLIKRRNFKLLENNLLDGRCPNCANLLRGIF